MQGFANNKVAFAGNGITQTFVNGIKQATTSGTEKFFSLPSGVKRFTVTMNNVSFAATAYPSVQLGTGGVEQATGYVSDTVYTGASTGANAGSTTRFTSALSGAAQGQTLLFDFVLHDAATNQWMVSMHGTSFSGASEYGQQMSGSVSLSGECDLVRVVSDTGAAFDTGSINIQYDNPDPTVVADSGHGTAVQTVHTEDGEVATGTTLIATDDSIPQITEGNEYLTASITPTNVANKLKIETVVTVSNSYAGAHRMTAALFQDSTADTLATTMAYRENAHRTVNFKFTHWMTAGTIASTTFSVRVGGNVAGTTTFSGWNAGRKHGGKMVSSITITEYEA